MEAKNAGKVTPLAGQQYYPVSLIDVAEFHESNDASDDPTAVLLIMKIEGEPDIPFILRLKSRQTTDELIAALMTHSKAVWPDDAA